MSEPNRYQIASVDDFRAVPLDRLGDCLRDFRSCLEHAALVVHGALEIAEAEGLAFPADACSMPSFEWIDDGKRSVDPQILEGKEEE